MWASQGAHGFWELATNKAYYPFFTAEFLSHILNATRSHHAGMYVLRFYGQLAVWR